MLLRRLRTLSLRFNAGVLLGLVLAAFASQDAAANGFFSKAASLTLIQATNNNARSVNNQANYYYQLAQNEIRAGEVELGKQLLQRALSIDPQHRQASEALARLNQSGVSITANPILASNDPMEGLSAEQLMSLGLARVDGRDYESAQRYFEEALARAESDNLRQTIRRYLATVAQQREQNERAFQAVLDTDLSELERQLQKAMHFLEADLLDDAEHELWRARQIAPEDRRVNAMWDQLERRRGQALRSDQVAQQTQHIRQASDQRALADQIFREGADLYRQGLIIPATDKWNEALQIFPEHQRARTYMANTRAEYEQAVRAREQAYEMAAEERRYEAMLDEVIPQYSTQGERVDVKDVYNSLSGLSGLNFILGEHVEGQVTFNVQEITIREILNRLQRMYGFVWTREGDTVFIEQGFRTKVFPLTERQFKSLETVLNDPSSLEDSSRNLRTILYGPQYEFDVPGKQLYLNATARSLVVTDTEQNLRAVEAFLEDMPEIVGEQKPVITKIYTLERDLARDIEKILRLMLYGDQGAYDVTDRRRKLFLEQSTNTLVVIDYPENIDMVEETLASEQFTRQLEEGEMYAQEFQITDVDDIEDTPEALARRQLFVNQIEQVVEAMLVGPMGRDAYVLSGRQIITNPERGTISVIDTKANIRKVEQYLNSVRGETTQDILIRTFHIQHVDVFQIADALGFLFFDTQQSTRSTFVSQGAFQSIGTTETGDTGTDVTNIFEEGTRQRFNLAGGGGGGADLLQFFSLRLFPEANTNSIVVVTPDQEVLDLVQRVISTFDKPLRQVQVEQRSVRVRLEDIRAINFDWLISNPFRGDWDFSSDNIDAEIAMITGRPSDQQRPGMEFSFANFGQSRLDFVMDLLESTTTSDVLTSSKMISIANPFVPPVMFVGQQVPFADSVTFDDPGTVFDPRTSRMTANFQRALVGASFGFLPFILNDDSVYLELVPQITQMGERLPVTVTGAAAPGAQIPPNIGPPTLSQIYMQTGVRVRNGDTVVLGGQVTETEQRTENRVPFLHKIPFLGRLFTDVDVEKVKDTILTFVTVQVIEPRL